jgi:hypothetical protein
MQNHLRNFIACSIAFVLFGCSNSENKSEKLTVTFDSTSNSSSNSTAAKENNNEERKFIRKANLRFKVKDVIQSTNEIESVAAKMHGFVTHTQLSSTIENEDHVEMSSDSTLVSTSFQANNSIVIRVPNNLLDSTLYEISKQITFLDYRTIDAQDVHLQLLANELAEKRNDHFQKRVSTTGKDSNKKTISLSVEESLLMTQEQKDNSRINNLELSDQINFSSISLYIYQNQTILHEMISNNKTDAFEPGFFYKLWDSIKIGWHALISFLLSITKIWAFILAAIVLYFVLKAFWIHKK